MMNIQKTWRRMGPGEKTAAAAAAAGVAYFGWQWWQGQQEEDEAVVEAITNPYGYYGTSIASPEFQAAQMPQGMSVQFGTSQPQPETSPAKQAFGLVRLVATPFALALSYKRNQSVGWAIVQGLLFPEAFLIYNYVSPK